MFALVALLATPWAMQAQTLTVANGTETNQYVPIYGYYTDAAQHNQVLYPGSMLTSMTDNYITEIAWYMSQTASSNWNTTVTLKMAIVPDSVLSSSLIADTGHFQTVWQGVVSGQSATLSFTLDSVFYYTGGNLLIDITTTAATYSQGYFYGQSTAAYYSNYSYDSYGSVYGGPQSFMPKATFTYNATGAVCYAPSGLTFDNNTTSSLTFHWNGMAGSMGYDIMVGDSVIYNVTDTFATVYDLNGSTRYEVAVRNHCGADLISAWNPEVVMMTQCAAIASLPWSTGFESEPDSVPVCWSRPSALVVNQYSGDPVRSPYIYPNSSYNAHTGSSSMYFYVYSYYGMPSDVAVVATPYFAHDPADLHVSFWLYPGTFSAGSTFEGGVMTDPTDTSTFVPLLTLTSNDLGDLDDYRQFEYYTSALTTLTDLTDDDSVCVAFRVVAGDVYSMYLYMDDVTVDAMGSCLPPVLNSGRIDSISYNAVQLSWDVPAEADEYSVRLVNLYSNDTTYYTAYDTTLLIETLSPDSTYAASVASVCGGDTTVYVDLATFTTLQRCYSVQNAAVGALTANAAALTWSFAGIAIEPTAVLLTLVDNSDATANPLEVTASDVTNYTFTGLTEGHNYTATISVICGSDGDTSSSVSLDFTPHAPACAEVTGAGSNGYVPFYSFYNNGFSESLYDASIIEGVDTINGISLQIASPVSRNNIIDIYMGYTTLSSLNGASAYVPVANLTHVVSDYSFNSGEAGWLEMIPFDSVFVTQPTGDSLHLIIAFYNHTGSYASGLYWATHTSPIGNSTYCYTDSPISISDPWSSVYSTYTTDQAPNIQFYGTCGGGDCLPPSATVSASDTASISLTWLPGGAESEWTIQYRQEGSTAWTTAGTTLVQPYTVSGLNAGTSYQFRVGSVCTDTVVYSSAVTGTTACGIMHAPFAIIPNGANSCWYFGGSGYYSSYSNYYYFYGNGHIVTPEIGDSINTLQVKLLAYGADCYIGACDANGANPEWIDTVSFPNGDYNTPELRKSYLVSYTGSKRHIIVRASNDYTYIYNVAIEPLDDCMPALNIALDSVTTSEAWLSWIGDGTSYEVQYHAESDTTGTWQTTTVSTNEIHLTGLNSNVRYQVKVFNVCSAGSRSDSATFRFAMGCTPFAVPFREQFGHDDMPVCWNTANFVSTASYPWTYSFSSYSNYISSEAPYNGSANDWLMTPMIQMPADASNTMLVYLVGGNTSSYTPGSNASYEVWVSTTGNTDTASYTRIYTDSSIYTYDATSYSTMLDYNRISLAAYSGQTISIAFRNTSTNYGEIYLGDVSVREVVNPLYYITGDATVFLGDTAHYYAIYQEGVTAGITFQWTSTMAAAGQAVMTGATTDSMTMVYNAEGVDTITFIATNQYGADTSRGLVYVYDCTPVSVFPFHESFETPTAPAGCWTLTYGSATANPMRHVQVGDDNYLDSVPDGSRVFRFSSYSSNSDYNQYLISRELAGTNMMLSFKYIKGSYSSSSTDNIRVGYSSTTRDTSAFTWGEWITDISIDDWTDFTDTIPDGTKFVAIQYWGDFAYYVYIDDLVINGLSAICNAPVPVVTDVQETTVDIRWDGDATSYQVAVVEGSWTEPANVTPVTDTFYTFTGLTEQTDYTLGVRAVCGNGYFSQWATLPVTTLRHPCAVPTDIAVSDETFDGATVSWAAGEAETDWQVRVFCASPVYDDTIDVSGTPSVVITGLANDAVYSVAVRAVCDSAWMSPWSDTVALTPETCPQVTGVGSSNVTFNAATISWNSTGAASYELEYGNTGFQQGSGHTATSNTASFNLTGLEEMTTYDVFVRSVCATGVTSEWSAKYTFTTPENNGIDDVAGSDVTLFPNPASTMVTIRGIEGESTVTVVDLNGREVYKTSANDNLTIDLTGYAKGAYFVRITGERTTAIRKLIVK